MLVDGCGERGVFVGFAVHDVAPVAPDRAHVKEDRLAGFLGEGKRGCAPLLPVHRLMHGGAQIRGGGFVEGVARFEGGDGPGLGHTSRLTRRRGGVHEATGDLDVEVDGVEQFLLRELFVRRVGDVNGAGAEEQRFAPVVEPGDIGGKGGDHRRQIFNGAKTYERNLKGKINGGKAGGSISESRGEFRRRVQRDGP